MFANFDILHKIIYIKFYLHFCNLMYYIFLAYLNLANEIIEILNILHHLKNHH